MNETIISWTGATWNPIHGCSKVSDGCKFCYAMTLSLKYGFTKKPWTIQNEADNVLMKPHKLTEPYKLKEAGRVFTNSMSDMFHHTLPDWYRAICFIVMLDNPHLTFQVLTKRATALADWPERFRAAIQTAEFAAFRAKVTHKQLKASLLKDWTTPWGANIWQGVSVEDARVLDRITDLRRSSAVTKFISAEPLLGAWADDVDLSGIDWVIVGGESGLHMNSEPQRWMKMEWARGIRDLCVKQGVAYFYKQDSGIRTEMRPYLIEEDGTMWEWHQYPGDLTAPVQVDAKGIPMQIETTDYDMPWEAYKPSAPQTPGWSAFDAITPFQAPGSMQNMHKMPTRVVSFRDVKAHWDREQRRWDSDDYVYIGRHNAGYGLVESIWANPFHITDEIPRDESIRRYRAYILAKMEIEPGLLAQLEALRGKTLVCWCAPKHACHGDVLIELLGDIVRLPAEASPRQLALL